MTNRLADTQMGLVLEI